jgi:hypothetical protein
MATYTHPNATSSAAVKAVHAGLNSKTSEYSFSKTMSSGDIVNLLKLPIGAVVVDVITRFTQTTGNVAQVGVGDDSVTERYNASISASGVNRATAGIPFSYSWVGTIRAYVTGTGSLCTGGTIRVTVLYKMDDPLVTN